MIIGNQQAQEMIERFFSALEQGETSFPFLLLQGRKHLGKTTLIDQVVTGFLGEYTSTDYLALYDFSDQLGKEHTIKIDTVRDEERIEIDGVWHHNTGMRALIQRLALAPLGKRKIVYLENIERMTGAAASALLKTLEEPLPGRLIIASSARVESLLGTIRSRALIIPFSPMPPSDLIYQLQTTYPNVSSALLEFASSFSLGAWGLAVQLLEDQARDDRAKFFNETKDRFINPGRIDLQLHRLKWFAEQGRLHALLDALLYIRGVDPTKKLLVDRLVRVKKLLETNVAQDRLLFRLCISP